MQYKKRKNRLKLISLVMSVVMLVPYMSGYSVATTEDNTAAVQSTSSETADVSQISPSLPTVLDLSTVPDIIGAEKAQSAGHVQRAYASEENLNTVSFNNADGTRTDYIFNHPVKYVDTDGKIKDITLGLQANSNKAGGYVSKDTRSQTAFSAKFTDGIMLSGGDVSIRLVPVLSRSGVATPVIPIAPVERSSVRYGNISVNISPIAELSADGKSVVYTCDSKTRYEYSLTYSGFKEDIIVSEYTGQTEYTFKLYTGGLTLTEDDGDFYLCDAYGNVKGTLGSVIVFTADWQNNTFGSMSAQTVTANQEYEITIHLDAEYLRDEATLYPITIDPTIELNYTSDPDGIQDIVINTVDILSGTDGEISAGKWGSDQSISRILMKFPGFELPSHIHNHQVIQATVYIRDLMCQHEELTLECYMYTGNEWSESNATWTNVIQPSSYSSDYFLDSYVVSYYKGLEQDVPHQYGFDVTLAFSGGRGESLPSKDIIFKASYADEANTTHNYKTFASYQRANYKPYLEVIYDDTIYDGIYRIKNAENGMYLGATNGALIGTEVKQQSFSLNNNLLFEIRYVGMDSNGILDYFTIRPILNDDIGVSSPYTITGSNVTLQSLPSTYDIEDYSLEDIWAISTYGSNVTIKNGPIDYASYLTTPNNSVDGANVLNTATLNLRSQWILEPYYN